ncbi:MAG: aminoacyl-tRNA hydrolase [Actinomycetota bacterium]|jgi:PTH1 family peptidyl-tRNA hydrolase|nr:aminoacyl-tRNA hydrolase [Actinomycetota bacterium]MDA3027422.1 aminoacyl-tRNA hydrolase [Actinomycetota bacterium]
MGLFSRRRSGDNPPDWLVLGLGNPGERYAHTRHNVGEDAVRLLASRHGGTMKAGKNDSFVAECRIAQVRTVLAVPVTFMNESGRAASSLVSRFGITGPDRIIVVHDELDLEPGTVRVKVAGGLAGHNGLRSITAHLSTQDYLRVRIGVGRPPNRDGGADYVLSKVPKAQREILDVGIELAADAVEVIITDGVDAAMRTVNAR